MSDDSKRDEARRKILARRASFVAAAMASVACGKEPQSKPEPCLAVPLDYQPPDAAPEPPRPCLTPMEPTTASPQPCLSQPMPPVSADPGQPQPCLKIRADHTDGGAPPMPPPRPCLTPKRPEDK